MPEIGHWPTNTHTRTHAHMPTYMCIDTHIHACVHTCVRTQKEHQLTSIALCVQTINLFLQNKPLLEDWRENGQSKQLPP